LGELVNVSRIGIAVGIFSGRSRGIVDKRIIIFSIFSDDFRAFSADCDLVSGSTSG
jgi:hypothetical protein